MAIVSIKSLVEAGVHFGTRSSLWHPKMAPYIFGKRNGVHIVDLRETARALIHAHHYLAKLAKGNKTVLFVGTKRQAKDVIRDSARSIGMPYVSERWLGGTLTNIETVRTSVRRLDDIEAAMARPDYHLRESKKQQARHTRERRRILRNLEGVRTMTRMPDAMFVVDPGKEATAVREARIVGIPIIALTDTDCDPDVVNLPIPGNDDGIRAIQAVIGIVVEAIRAGRAAQVTRAEGEDANAESAEPVAAAAETGGGEASPSGEATGV